MKMAEEGRRIAGKEAAVLFRGPPNRWSYEKVEEWLDSRPEDPFQPHVPIIDPHHHLFPAPSSPLPSSIPQRVFDTFGRAPASSQYLREELTKDFRSMNVVATVHVEAKTNYNKGLKYPSVGETIFLRGIYEQAPHSGLCRGIVAAIDLTPGPQQVREQVEAHREALKGSSCVLSGVRAQIAHHDGLVSPAKPGMAMKCAEGAKVVGELGLPIDIWLYHHQLRELAALALACPNTTFVCDHLGTPTGSSPSVFDEWLTGMEQLSRCGNVHVKLGKCNFSSVELESCSI